jgi:hypothetical protein
MSWSRASLRRAISLVFVGDGQFVALGQVAFDVPVEVEDRDGLARLWITAAPPAHPVAASSAIDKSARRPRTVLSGKELLHLAG